MFLQVPTCVHMYQSELVKDSHALLEIGRTICRNSAKHKAN